jgi:Na+/melibiose symporter-like transporter
MGVLLLSIAFASRYPLTREMHEKTVSELARRRSARRDATPPGSLS